MRSRIGCDPQTARREGGESTRALALVTSAAAALGVAGSLTDAGFLAPLLEDEHPAVRLAAMQALAAVDDPGLVAVAVQRYPTEALAVRLFITSTLRTVWRHAEPTYGDRTRVRASLCPQVTRLAWFSTSAPARPGAVGGLV